MNSIQPAIYLHVSYVFFPFFFVRLSEFFVLCWCHLPCTNQMSLSAQPVNTTVINATTNDDCREGKVDSHCLRMRSNIQIVLYGGTAWLRLRESLLLFGCIRRREYGELTTIGHQFSIPHWRRQRQCPIHHESLSDHQRVWCISNASVTVLSPLPARLGWLCESTFSNRIWGVIVIAAFQFWKYKVWILQSSGTDIRYTVHPWTSTNFPQTNTMLRFLTH